MLLHTFFAVVGIYYLGSALEGYLWGIGKINLPSRAFLAIGGLLIAFPEMITTLIGLGIAFVVNLICFLIIRKKREVPSLEIS